MQRRDGLVDCVALVVSRVNQKDFVAIQCESSSHWTTSWAGSDNNIAIVLESGSIGDC